MENAKKSLLTDNKKALQFLHQAYGFNFQKEHVIIKGNGKFTFNTVEKEIKSRINGNYTAVILVKHSEPHYKTNELYCAVIGKYKFDPLRQDKVSYWDYKVDYWFGIGDFEESRKKQVERYYIVAQLNNYILPIDRSGNINLDQRFIHIESRDTHATDGKGKHWISGLELKPYYKNVKPFEYRPYSSGMITFYNRCDDLTSNANEIIDKSGYILIERKRELQRKAKALRAERKNAEATKADYSERENKIRKTTKDIQWKLADKLMNAGNNAETMQNIDTAITKLHWVVRDITSYFNTKDNNKFSSIADIENRLTHIETKLAEMA